MQCKNTANDLLNTKDFEVFMNNSIKTGQHHFSTRNTFTDKFIPMAVATRK